MLEQLEQCISEIRFDINWRCELVIWMARERGFDVRVVEVPICQN